MCLMNLLDIFRKDKKLKIELINVNNPLTDYIKKILENFKSFVHQVENLFGSRITGTSCIESMRPEVGDLISTNKIHLYLMSGGII